MLHASSSTHAPAARPAAADYAYTRTANHDADEAAQRLHAWDQTYRQLTPGRFEGLTTDFWFEPMQLFRERSNRRIHQAGRSWSGSVTFGILLSIDGPVRFCGQAMDLDSMMMLSGTDELDLVTSPMLDIVGIAIPQDRLTWLDASGRGAGERGPMNRLLRLRPAAAARLREVMQSIFDTIEADPSRLSAAAVREQVRDDVIDALAAATWQGVVEAAPGRRHLNRRSVVQRATEHVLAHRGEPVSVEQLCECVKVSRRSLQYAFEHTLGISPLEYLRVARLHGVRRELKSTPRGTASIQDVAARWGFWHLGHFTTHYRQLFGCRPSETPRPV
ncbi:MAG: helix-turn-helix domain-containing protein [Burkholderiales bacterium]|nr:helix-turn-helix domain-containing protein [Burkholderiales bacterium]